MLTCRLTGFEFASISEGAALALAAMVVPAAVQEVDTAIDGPAHDADGVGGVVRNSQVIAADTYDRYLLARPAELAVRHLVVHVHALAVDPSKEGERDTDVLNFTVRAG